MSHIKHAVVDLGIGDMGSRPGRHLAGGDTAPTPTTKKIGMVKFAKQVNDIMSPCGAVGKFTWSEWAP